MDENSLIVECKKTEIIWRKNMAQERIIFCLRKR
jgi:hypothetical protein